MVFGDVFFVYESIVFFLFPSFFVYCSEVQTPHCLKVNVCFVEGMAAEVSARGKVVLVFKFSFCFDIV